MRRPIRFFLVPWQPVALAVTIYAFIYGAFDLSLRRLGLKWADIGPQIAFIHLIPLALFAFAYGFYRMVSTHPVFNAHYCKWLANTPWRPGIPLPLGPVSLAWQDLLVMAALALFSKFIAHSDPAIPVVALLVGYLLAAFAVVVVTRQMAEMLAIFMIVPVFIYTGPFWWLDLVVLAVLYLITLYALHRSWRKFPWPEQMRELEKTKSKRNPGQSVQWPFDRLNGYSPRKLYNLREIIILSLLIGWDRFAVLDGIHDPDLNDPREIALAFALIGGGAALFRAIVYVGCGLPPLSLLGRIVLRRPIIPTYDRIFLAPIGIALTAALLPILLTAIGLYPPLMAAFTAAVLFTMLAALPPRLRNWQLTGHSRMLIIRPKRAPASTVIVDRGRASRASRFES